jgi:hypothetical protein
MLEIIAVIFIGKKLAELAKSKGRSGWLGVLGPLAWFGGEFCGGCIGALMGLEGLAIYPLALILGGIGAGVVYFGINSLPNAEGYDPDYPGGGGGGGQPCPTCSSVMTERRGDTLTCNNCGFEGAVDPYGRA